MLAALIVSSWLAASPLEAEIRAVAALPGEPRIVSAAGVTRDETPILTLENPDALDPAAVKRRLVLVGSAGGDSAEAIVAAVKWFKTSAPRTLRQQWTVSALPSASFEPADALSLPRWITFQAPEFYERRGYRVLGGVECPPPGHTRTSIAKASNVGRSACSSSNS